MISIRLHMEFSPQTYDEAASALRSLVGPVRSEPGCSATRLHTDTRNRNHLTWVEEWRSVEDFEQHLRKPVFRQILAVIEMAQSRPSVEIDNVSSRCGFELVEEILGGIAEGKTHHELG